MRFETQAIHVGRHIDPATGALAAPIHLSTTYERDIDGEYRRGFSYAREGNPNRQALECCLATLEGGKEALAFSSGMAVLATLLQCLEPGDHVIAPEDVYYGNRGLAGKVMGRWPLETTYVDMADLEAVQAAIRPPATRLIWLETPSNPHLRITDLAAIGEMARKANAITVADSTFATPVLQRPFAHGIDMVMHSTTKYIGGHHDLTGGILVTAHDNYLFERARQAQHYAGAVPSPFDCWLALRGLDSLAYRVRGHCENALKIAQFLEQHPQVERVYYPGLPSHPGHPIAMRQMRGGFGGMLSFEVKGCRAEALAVASKVKLIARATSLGGAHSLIEHRASVEGPGTRTAQNLLRMSIGLEHVDDIREDLAQALN